MQFYLGTHEPHWLKSFQIPIFVSRVRLARYRRIPRAAGPWALDSGGFSALLRHGRWTISAEKYVGEVRRYRTEIGQLQWAAVMDWMCEPFMVAKTGLSIQEHQERTIDSYLTLTMLAPEIPWVPVLQGWQEEDYWSHLKQYQAAGIDLRKLPLVGLGSVCRRQGTAMAEGLIRDLYQEGLRLHGFGFKFGGLLRCAPWLTSADSMAWSYNARKHPPLPGCKHLSCANCPRWARAWQERLVKKIASQDVIQGSLF